MKTKQLYLIFTAMLFRSIALAQVTVPHIGYSYDATGNRTQRKVVVSPPMIRRDVPDSMKVTQIHADSFAYAHAIHKDTVVPETTISKEQETEMRKAMKYGISAFPNPAGSLVNVTISSLENNDQASLTLIDEVGRFVYSKQQFTQQDQLDISAYKSGVYYLKVQMPDGEIIVYKIIKID